ncbi:hypothetical protein ACFL4E_00470 [Candidatus Omnitrophota bacterium]
MRKLFTMCVAAFMLLACFVQNGMCREQVNFYDILNNAREVKTYVADITDSSGQAKGMTGELKKVLEDALATRMSIHFVLVKDKKDADIVITCDITESIWLKDDPIDNIHGIGPAAYDIAMKQNYARMNAVFTVERGPEKKELFKWMGGRFLRREYLWKEEISGQVTKTDMPEKESIPLVEERLVKVFMRRCFSRNAKPLK